MELSEITFKRLYQQVTFNLKKMYNKASSAFTLASPFGQILQTVIQLFQLNILHVQSVQRSLDLNDALNNNKDTVRMLTKVGQYNPSRGQAASGAISLKLKEGIDLETSIPGNKVLFENYMRLKNISNNLEYILDLGQENLTFTLTNKVPIILNVIQGTWKEIPFTGTGEINQSFVVPVERGKELDNFRFELYVNSELYQNKKHKFDMLENEKAYVAYTSFSGGIDILFGNGSEGYIPRLGDIIIFRYLVTDGQEGNLPDYNLNDFKFLTQPRTYYGEDIQVDEFFDIDVENKINFGTNGDSINYLKSILPYASSNFVLAGVDQYKFFLLRLGVFSLVDVYVSKRNEPDMINKMFQLAQENTNLLNKIQNSDNNSTLKQIVERNLKEIVLMRKLLLTEGGNNLVNLFLIPDIRVFYGNSSDLNYFNSPLDLFLLDQQEKNRVLNYLSAEGIQTITNEIKIVDPVIKKYAVNLTVRLFDDAIEDNINNEIINLISEYFITEMRRDRIPASDIVRIIDGEVKGVDSVIVQFISEDNENYHKEYLVKAQDFNIQNKRYPLNSEIIMSNGLTYDSQFTPGLDSLLGDIVIEKNELPLIRGGFLDRYNNNYGMTPGIGQYSPVNILILPERTPRKQMKII